MTSIGMKRLLRAAAMALSLAAGGASYAQQTQTSPNTQPQAQPPASAQAAPAATAPATSISAETKAARAKLDGFKADLDQKEAAIQGRTMSDADLQNIRLQIEPIIAEIRTVVEEQAPKLEASKQRLTQLGPKPDKGQPEESADVARDRAEREAAVAELDETQRLGRALLVQAEQLNTQIGDLRRAGFARALFEQSDGLFSPSLWMNVVQAVPRELRALGIVLDDALEQLRRSTSLGILLLLGLAVGAAIALYVGRRSIAPRLVRRNPAITDPSRRSRLLAALGVLILGAAPAIAGSWIVWVAFDSSDIVPPRLEQVGRAILSGLAFIAFVRALIDAILAPDHTSWRLIPVRDASATRIMSFSVTLATVMVVGKVIEAFNTAIAAALPVTVITRAIFALAAALVFAELLRRFAARENQDEACLGPYVAPDVDIGGPLRSFGWFLVALVVGSVLGGYVALASFVIDQAVWISIVVALLVLCVALADEFIGGSLRGQTRLATTLQANTGLRRRSLEQIGVLGSGVARLALIIVGILLVLAPWGIESTDVTGSLRAAFFGFNVGDVTISLSSILLAALLFGAGFAVTRMIQRWLNNTFLPATDLDAGLRNSISTAAGYVGIITAGALGRYRFRPAIHRQQFHLRPDPALGAPDPRRRSGGRRGRGRLCAPDQCALDGDPGLRPIDDHRAELEPDLRHRAQPRAQRSRGPRARLDPGSPGLRSGSGRGDHAQGSARPPGGDERARAPGAVQESDGKHHRFRPRQLRRRYRCGRSCFERHLFRDLPRPAEGGHRRSRAGTGSRTGRRAAGQGSEGRGERGRNLNPSQG
jgi:potassium-dependent mechanosensitive channel